MQGLRTPAVAPNKAAHTLHRLNSEALITKRAKESEVLVVMTKVKKVNAVCSVVVEAEAAVSATSSTTELSKNSAVTDTKEKDNINNSNHMQSTALSEEVQTASSLEAPRNGVTTSRPSTLSKMLTARSSKTANTSCTLRTSSSLPQLEMSRNRSRTKLEQQSSSVSYELLATTRGKPLCLSCLRRPARDVFI